jgi:hypothetical protein
MYGIGDVTGGWPCLNIVPPAKVKLIAKLGRFSLARFCDLVSHYLSITTSLHCRLSHFAMNISGTLNVFRLIKDPTLCLPQHTVSTFNHLPIPLSKAFPKKNGNPGEKDADIQAVVLDKDNCFAAPHTNEIHKPYHVRLGHTNSYNQYPMLTPALGPLPAPSTSLSWFETSDRVQHSWNELR